MSRLKTPVDGAHSRGQAGQPVNAGERQRVTHRIRLAGASDGAQRQLPKMILRQYLSEPLARRSA